MNKPAVLCNITLIVLLFLMLFIGCTQEAPPSIKVPLPGPFPSNGTTEKSSIYTNTEYGFSFNFIDTEFELLENYRGFNVALLGPLLWDMSYQINIVIAIGELPEKMSLTDFVEKDIKNSESKLPDYEIVDQYTTAISGLPTEVVVFTFTNKVGEEMAKFNNISAAFIKDDIVYMIKYDVPEEFHEDYLNNFNTVISSFQFY